MDETISPPIYAVWSGGNETTGTGEKEGEFITLQDSRDSSGDTTIHLKWPSEVSYNPLKMFIKNQADGNITKYHFKICRIGKAC